MGKEADLLFTIPIGVPFWLLEEHELLIVAFFFLLSHAGNGEVSRISEEASCQKGQSENLIENTRGNRKGFESLSWEGSCRNFRKNLVGGVGIFCGFMHKTRAITFM